MPSCWPPVAWPSLPCSTSCSDPARRIRKATPDVRRSPCRWASFFVPPDCRGRYARVNIAAPLPYGRRTAHGASMIRKKDESERNGEFPRADVRRAACDGRAARASWPRAGSVRTERGGNTGPAKACRTAGASQGAAHEGQPSLLAGAPCPDRPEGLDGLPRQRRTGHQGGKAPLSCLLSGRTGRRDHGTGRLRPSRPWTDHAAGEKKGWRACRTADKKTTGCPGGGAAGQRGRMF